jgi:hypothetical protein
MTSKRNIEKRITDIEPSSADEKERETSADLWRRFIEGEYDVETPHPQIQQWLGTIRRGQDR